MGKRGNRKKMYSLNMGYRAGNFDKVGMFFEVMNKTNPGMTKRQALFPSEYIELSKEEIVKVESV